MRNKTSRNWMRSPIRTLAFDGAERVARFTRQTANAGTAAGQDWLQRTLGVKSVTEQENTKMLDHDQQMLVVNGITGEAFNAAEAVRDAARQATLPHVLMRPRVFLDQPGHWCAMYGECLADSPAGYGDSPYAACADFDRRWLWSQAQIDKCDADEAASEAVQP